MQVIIGKNEKSDNEIKSRYLKIIHFFGYD